MAVHKTNLVLMHLSDIHFHKESDTFFDLDLDLRNELERDAEVMGQRLDGVDGILITGDVVYAGHADEYDKARKWLTTLCDITGCRYENTWMCPGNHDVDREEIKNNEVLSDLHSTLRSIPIDEIDEKIKKYFLNATGSDLFLRPIRNYNAFASAYGCEISSDKLFWQHDLSLNDGSKLRLNGLSSTLISNALDDTEAHKLILSSYQVQFNSEPGVEHISLCHHPLDWLRDYDMVDSKLGSRVRIQLFGHKHEQVIREIDQSLRIVAGATHPERRARQWVPRYNFMCIHIEKDDADRKLHVDIYPRMWTSDHKFDADYKRGFDVRPYVLDLPAWEDKSNNIIDSKGAEKKMQACTTEASDKPAGVMMHPERKLVYRFFGLGYSKQMAISVKLGLVLDEDRDLPELKLFAAVLRRAKESGKLHVLWDEVEKASGEGKTENPFSSDK